MKTCLLVFLFSFGIVFAQETEFLTEDIQITPLVRGTLLMPKDSEKTNLVILVGDSGPIDRNGNQQMMGNNHLRYLAEGLSKRHIASFRYDKRIIPMMQRGAFREENIHFQDFIDDAVAVIKHFKEDKRFSKIYIIGHGEGSLVGMVVAQNNVDGFISIAGAGQELDDMIVAQLNKQAPGLADNARQSFDDLRANGQAYNFSPGLASIFRKEIQPFLYSWMQFDPKEELAKLKIPVLIINGDKDLQVDISEAEILKQIKPDSEYLIIPDMNHIFKKIVGDGLENSKSYNEYKIPVMPELINHITEFIKKNSKE